MSKKAVFCIASSIEQADRIVDRLRSENFSNNDISALFADKESTHEFAHEKNTKAPEGAITGVGTGWVIGGALGWIAGIGALAIPGMGPFIAAGPIMSALSGIAIGGAIGGLAGALIGMGIPELEAKRYEGKIHDGNILISVHTENAEEVRKARELFEEEGAGDICTTGEASVPKSTRAPRQDKARHRQARTTRESVTTSHR